MEPAAVTVLSLLVGSLGLQAVTVGTWLGWRQRVTEREQEEEEETLTPYESNDTVKSGESRNGSRKQEKAVRDPRLVGWEFKIVRSNRDVFRDPALLQRLCEEESQAGWILLEKLDDRRVRFKRPIALREIIKPEVMPIDPYRSYYGMSTNWQRWLLAPIGLVLLVLPAYLGFMLVSTTLHPSQPVPTAPQLDLPSDPNLSPTQP